MRRLRATRSSTGTTGGGALSNYITFPSASIPSTSSIGTAVGTAGLAGPHTGTATWSLTNSAGGKYAIGSSTGAVTVAAALSAGTDNITIAVSGLTPAYGQRSFPIIVTNGTYTPTYYLLGF